MTHAQAEAQTTPIDPGRTAGEEPVLIRTPALSDGKSMWTLARDTQVLDLNSSYAYLLWCRDFARTSVIAEVGGAAAGFVTGYMRPEAPETLMIWQVAVDARFRGRRIAASMLDDLAARTGAVRLETTITDDNSASIGLFSAFAQRHDARLTTSPLFTPADYPDGHDTEFLYEIGPLQPQR